MRTIVLILLSLQLLNCKGQSSNSANTDSIHDKLTRPSDVMDTIYEQQHGKIILRFIRNSNDNNIEWKLILTNKNGRELTLHSEHIEKNSGWRYQESVGESPIDLYNIASSYLDEKNLYIIYNRFGEVFIIKYFSFEEEKFEEEKKIIQGYLVSGGFGNMVNRATLKRINNNLYFNLLTGQTGTGTRQSLYKLDLSAFTLKQIKFDEKPKPIKAICISDSGKKWYEQEKRNIEAYNKLSTEEKNKRKSTAPTEREINKLNFLKQYLQKPFYFKEMSTDKDKYEKEETDIKNNGLGWYPLFSARSDDNNNINFQNIGNKEFLPIDNNKINKAEEYLKEAIAPYLTKESLNKIKIIDYIYQSAEGYNIFFFYRDNSSEIKIIRYNNYNNEWLVGDYQEEEIKVD